MKDILFIILNLDENDDRMKSIEKYFEIIKQKIHIDYIRIGAVNGFKLENDEFVKKILFPKKDLIGKNFVCDDFEQTWKYDCEIKNSFPGLNLYGHEGTKGLTMSNLKAFQIIMTKYYDYDWYCIIEDDSIIQYNDIKLIKSILKNKSIFKKDIILLDKRSNGYGGTCAMMYNNKIIKYLFKKLHPLSNFSIKNAIKKNYNLWDCKLWSFIDHYKLNVYVFPLIYCDSKFISTISFP